jgi:hypothetical protein
MVTHATYQGIPICIEVHVLPHSSGTTYGILFAKAGTEGVIGFVTSHYEATDLHLDPTDVLLHPDTPEATTLLMDVGYVLPTGCRVGAEGGSIPVYRLTDLALTDPLP